MFGSAEDVDEVITAATKPRHTENLARVISFEAHLP